MIKLLRAYTATEQTVKGYAILIDRLWPRGINKINLKMDIWMKELAPSILLRKWFDHDPAKWIEFRKKYKLELTEKVEEIVKIKELEHKHKTIVLLFAAKDVKYNHAVVLKEVIDKYE
jgi:uncharacterized protein YeaO (DUF488 family)